MTFKNKGNPRPLLRAQFIIVRQRNLLEGRALIATEKLLKVCKLPADRKERK